MMIPEVSQPTKPHGRIFRKASKASTVDFEDFTPRVSHAVSPEGQVRKVNPESACAAGPRAKTKIKVKPKINFGHQTRHNRL